MELSMQQLYHTRDMSRSTAECMQVGAGVSSAVLDQCLCHHKITCILVDCRDTCCMWFTCRRACADLGMHHHRSNCLC